MLSTGPLTAHHRPGVLAADCPRHPRPECLRGCDVNELKHYPGTATVSVGLDVSTSVESDFEALVSMVGKVLGARSK
jgi:hypothetical protein